MSLLRLILLAGLLASGMYARATHIVGGELTYRHIRQDSFEITLVLYIDCIYGNPSAVAQDSTAIIGIFDASNVLLRTMSSPRSLPQRVNSVNYNCVQPPSNACVDQYTYRYYTSLPQVTGGYVIAFQRCCRNNSINNIVVPGNTGATYWTQLNDTIQTSGYNTAAVFNALPPNFLCNQRDFVFDHSASDADGDSLAYSLYTPFHGASTAQPRPLIPSAPPYPPVGWLPPYNANAMMLGAPELTIHPQSGELTVKPQNTGQFVVGIQVQEFRRGQLVGVTRRDFQFNVLNCLFDAVSAFANDLTVCNDTVRFVNQSAGATAYFWDFGDPATDRDTSTEKDPVYVYPGPGPQGAYRVKLVISNGNCTDSSFATVTLLKDTARFAGPDTAICLPGSVLLGTPGGEYAYKWTPATYLDDPSLPRPTSTPKDDIEYIVERKNNWCTNVDSIRISILRLFPSFSVSVMQGCDFANIRIDSIAPFSKTAWFLNESPVSMQELLSYPLQFDSLYRIRLVVDSLGCLDEARDSIRVTLNDTIDFIPNAFTPDGDGVNDCYAIGNIDLGSECNRIFVYNRWGVVVFDSREQGACWNGTWQNNPLPQGTYYYLLVSHGSKFHGTIALIRQ